VFGKQKEKIIVVDCAFNCMKEKCPKWVVLYHNLIDDKGVVTKKSEGKCAMAWIPSLLIELNETLRSKQ